MNNSCNKAWTTFNKCRCKNNNKQLNSLGSRILTAFQHKTLNHNFFASFSNPATSQSPTSDLTCNNRTQSITTLDKTKQVNSTSCRITLITKQINTMISKLFSDILTCFNLRSSNSLPKDRKIKSLSISTNSWTSLDPSSFNNLWLQAQSCPLNVLKTRLILARLVIRTHIRWLRRIFQSWQNKTRLAVTLTMPLVYCRRSIKFVTLCKLNQTCRELLLFLHQVK